MPTNINIGIEEPKRKETSEGLYRILADTYVLYAKTQFFHWNVTGPFFFSLHELFEKQYEHLADAADDVAERIRTLGYLAPGGLSHFLALSGLKDAEVVSEASEMVRELVGDHEHVIQEIRSVLAVAQDSGDQGTLDLLVKQLQMHEKEAWILRSHVEEERTGELLKEAV